MRHSQLSRRGFLTTAAGAVAGASALDSANSSETSKPERGTRRTPGTPKQDEDGVVYHREIHKSDLMLGFPPPRDKRVTIDNYAETTHAIRWTHLNADVVFKSKKISKTYRKKWG